MFGHTAARAGFFNHLLNTDPAPVYNVKVTRLTTNTIIYEIPNVSCRMILFNAADPADLRTHMIFPQFPVPSSSVFDSSGSYRFEFVTPLPIYPPPPLPPVLLPTRRSPILSTGHIIRERVVAFILVALSMVFYLRENVFKTPRCGMMAPRCESIFSVWGPYGFLHTRARERACYFCRASANNSSLGLPLTCHGGR